MIIDSSAIISILREEEDHVVFATAIAAAKQDCKISTATVLEITVVLTRAKDQPLITQLAQLLDDFEIEHVSFTVEQQLLATAAFQRYGRGSGHPANLNLGDCFAYALAKECGQPLLFKGSDFTQTDIESAL